MKVSAGVLVMDYREMKGLWHCTEFNAGKSMSVARLSAAELKAKRTEDNMISGRIFIYF